MTRTTHFLYVLLAGILIFLMVLAIPALAAEPVESVPSAPLNVVQMK